MNDQIARSQMDAMKEVEQPREKVFHRLDKLSEQLDRIENMLLEQMTAPQPVVVAKLSPEIEISAQDEKPRKTENDLLQERLSVLGMGDAAYAAANMTALNSLVVGAYSVFPIAKAEIVIKLHPGARITRLVWTKLVDDQGKFPNAAIAAVAYAASKLGNEVDAQRFMKALATGVPTYANDAAVALRDLYQRDSISAYAKNTVFHVAHAFRCFKGEMPLGELQTLIDARAGLRGWTKEVLFGEGS